MSGNKQILKLDDAANTAAYNEALQYFESLGFRGKTASDLAIEKVHNNVLFDAGTLPDVDIVAKAWGDGDDASRRENYQKAQKTKREEETKKQQSEFNQNIRNATDKWGYSIGSGLEMISGFTPLWWVAPAVRTGLNLSEGNYKGAALNAGLAFAAPYAIGKGIQYVTPHVKSAIIASKLNRQINKTTLPLYSTRYYTKSVGQPGHVNYTLHNADGSVAGGLRVESPYSAGTRGTHIEMVHKTSGSKGGVSEDLYNIAVKDAQRAGLPGVESGQDLMNPLLTKHVTSKFPHIEEMIGTPQMVKNPTTGKWEFKQTIPGRMLTGTTSKQLALEAPQGHFITNYSATATNPPPKTSLAFFERQPAKISDAERLGIPKGERNAYLIGTNADPSYYTAIGLNNSRYTQRLRNFHFEQSFPGIERTTVYHGNMIPDNMMQQRGLSPYFDGGRQFGYFSSSSYPIAKTYNFVNGAPTYSLYPIIKKPYVLQANGRNGMAVDTNKFNQAVKTDQVVKQAFDAGHDGVIIKDVVDIGPLRDNLKNASEVADDIITLPGKAKMTDAITYDDLYQIIPLSQRDNILIHDIRYKQGGSIKIEKKNKGKFAKVRDYVDCKNNK